MSAATYKIFSKNIQTIPYLSVFLQSTADDCGDIDSPRAVVGWGLRPTTKKAQAYAKQQRLPYVALEDGFLRSFAPGQDNPPLSLIVDEVGIYYDANRPSQLENLLNGEEDVLTGTFADGTPYDQALVTKAMNEILTHHLSKYNHVDEWDCSVLQRNPRWKNRQKVLIIDQTVGDVSIHYAQASAQSFNDMLVAARKQYPGAVIVVKTHPQVSSGDKEGHFSELLEDDNTCLLQSAVNPIKLLREIDIVYTVSSTMGFEALLVGKPVHCFGLPWYAGWGVTTDYLSCPRRIKKRTVIELFAAAYCRYVRYLNPENKQLGTIFHSIQWLKRQKRFSQQYPQANGRLLVVGFRRWKVANVKPLLSLYPDRVFFVQNARQLLELNPQVSDSIVVWGNIVDENIQRMADTKGCTVLRMEDGFLRSVGLGSDFTPPNSIVLDERGLYFDPSNQSTLEYRLKTQNYGTEQCLRAEKIRKQIVSTGLSKYNTDLRECIRWEKQDKQPVVLVVGQVEDDASIRFGCTEVKTNLALLRCARAENPTALVVYKPHPDVQSRNRRGAVTLEKVQQYADYIETTHSMVSCIEACDVLYTMTSLSGFDALLRGKAVVVYGRPFYAGWGLTQDKSDFSRGKQLSLDALVYATLVDYPLYWDWALKGYTNCEGNMDNLLRQRQQINDGQAVTTVTDWQRQWRKLKILWRAYVTNR